MWHKGTQVLKSLFILKRILLWFLLVPKQSSHAFRAASNYIFCFYYTIDLIYTFLFILDQRITLGAQTTQQKK